MSWSIQKLESLCEVFTDGNWIESKDQSSQGVRLIQTGNIGVGKFKNRRDNARFISENKFVELKCFEIFEGDCLISRLPDPVGRSCIVPKTSERMITAVDCSIVRFNKKYMLPEFFNYFSQSSYYLGMVESLTSGATRKRISRKNLGLIEVPTPLIPEQKRIVTILDQAFADIEQARAKTEQNLKNARELFESYLQQIFSQRGDGWIEYPLGSICNFKHGFAFKSEYFTENSDLVLLTPGNFFEEGGYKDRGNKQKYYDGPFPKDFLLTKNSLLVAMTEQAVGLLGSPALVPDDDIFLHNQRLGLVELTSEFEGKVSMEFLFHLFNTKHFRSKVQETASGAKVRHTSPKKMQVITVSLPNDINEQRIIAQKLFCLKEKSLELEGFYSQKLLYLDELKKSILQKAFAGELSKSIA
ncbi:restriction endonuclease subunit S [Shewanella sp. SG41-3]|uniref:restriction endonuclease subunit S n=1 Tax=Shewanella sp. SG41-3 TaxID=2760977 RepID=UPI0016013113|nr:restriction endonuclease subunit S [Shewanella sp. SG41-3]MBB1476847.1 restriction endonuclease subunit S [Shewanella sp. SG41-3]